MESAFDPRVLSRCVRGAPPLSCVSDIDLSQKDVLGKMAFPPSLGKRKNANDEGGPLVLSKTMAKPPMSYPWNCENAFGRFVESSSVLQRRVYAILHVCFETTPEELKKKVFLIPEN